jgi:hypothetical protein
MYAMDANLVETSIRANRYLYVLRATLKDALAEGLTAETEIVRTLVSNIDTCLFILGEENTATEKFVIDGERMIKEAKNAGNTFGSGTNAPGDATKSGAGEN